LRDNHSLTHKCDYVLPKAAIFRVSIWGKFTVLDRSQSSPAERIGALVQKLLAKRSVMTAAGRDDDLTEIGLTSLDMVNLMLAIESEFDVKIPDKDITLANFRTMARIEALVATLMEHE
jgi:acyl carrier protein